MEETYDQVRDLNSPRTNQGPILRLEIPLFEGSKPRWWIRRCERYFEFYSIPENQRIMLASAYLNNVADCWYQGWSRSRGMGARWIDFAKEMCVRFGKRNMADVIEEFNKLRKDGTVTEY